MSATTDQLLKTVITSNKFAVESQIAEAREWGAEFHPDKDLADLLFMRGVIDRTQVALIRRLAKMKRGSAHFGRAGEAAQRAERTQSKKREKQEERRERRKRRAKQASAASSASGSELTSGSSSASGAELSSGSELSSSLIASGSSQSEGDPEADIPTLDALEVASGEDVVGTAESPVAKGRSPADALDETPTVAPHSPPKALSPDLREQVTRELPTTRAQATPARIKSLRRGKAPERVGRYEVIEKLAHGGMGVVYKVRHTDLDRIFALKVLTPRTEASAEALARFQREAKIAARLDHPNIVRVYDAGLDDDLPFLVMDFIDGPNLDELLKEEGIGARKAAQITARVALALQYAHENGVVHRDVKPENVILDRATGQPKITDFGIVKLEEEDEEARKLTQTGFTLGSPCYMAPEQAEGRHDIVGPRSDVYSLAATLYEMLTGEPPFDGDSIHEIMTKVVRDEPLSVEKRNPAVPRDLGVVCMKALEKEPERRYASAKAFAQDLERYLADEAVEAKPAGLWTKSLRVVRRNRLSSALVALLFLSVVAGLATVAYNQRERRLQERAEREELVESARRGLAAGDATEKISVKRHAWFEALRDVELVLRTAPKHAAALELKQRLVLQLGDHLLESGDPSFAEFLYAAYGAGVIDIATVRSRVATARQGKWVSQAERAEQRGDLEAALDLYTKGLRALQEAGLGGKRLQRRIQALQRAVARAGERDKVEQLVRLAEQSSRRGEHGAAYRTYVKALELAPGQKDLEGRRQLARQRAREEVLKLTRQVATARAQAVSIEITLGKDAVRALVAKGDAAQRKANAALARDEFESASHELGVARGHHQAAYALSSATRARALSAQEGREAEKRQASRFAPRQVGFAKELQARGDESFRRGDYTTAQRSFEQAATYYRLAARQGGSKSKVADARNACQQQRRELLANLPQNQRTPRFLAAEADFARAERHYDAQEYEPARELYERASQAYQAVSSRVPEIKEAFATQIQVTKLRKRCEEEFALEFASDDFSRARQSQLEGDTALASDNPKLAREKYADAAYRYRRALTKAKPQAKHKREYEQALQQAMDLRSACVDEKVDWMEGFKRAEDYLRKAKEAYDKRYWNGARRSLEKAVRMYKRLLED